MKKTLLAILVLLTTMATEAQVHKKREMRAAWIATVANIDWPSRPGLSVEQQRKEMIDMLDKLAENKVNTIVMQIRPTADSFYPSTLEPWSNWLTGRQGTAPSPFYDPLQFIIDEAHSRCMEVHVWLNPYRVTNSDRIDILHQSNLFFKQRNLFVKYGGKHYFDPGHDATRAFLNRVVEDIVQRYDVDAIHFDDYFYPYKVANEQFPDDETFKNNPRGFAPNQKDDWRRNNVDMIIAELQATIKRNKPWVEFGISPFGVWRNNNVDPRGSATRAGVQNYDDLYADILKWLREGTIDYVVPQLYWEIGKKVADYEILVKWWSENSYGKNLYIGLYTSQLGNTKVDPAWTRGNELMRQMRMNLRHPEVDGAMHFSAKGLLRNPQGLSDSLKTSFYKYPAITPVNRNIAGTASAQPLNLRVLKDSNEMLLLWDKVHAEGGNAIRHYVVYAFKGKQVGDMNDPANILAFTTQNLFDLRRHDPKMKGYYTFVVTSVNRFKHESPATYAVTRKL